MGQCTNASVNVRLSSQVMMGRLRRSLYVGRITEYLFSAALAMMIVNVRLTSLQWAARELGGLRVENKGCLLESRAEMDHESALLPSSKMHALIVYLDLGVVQGD